MTPDLDRIRDIIVHQLTGLERLFVPEARLTFVMRVPGDSGSQIIISADPELQDAIEEWMAKEDE